MTATTMRFGPEWMRKPASAKPLLATSPPPSGTPGGTSNGGTPAPPGTTSYSALVTPHNPPVQGKHDIAHPFKYSRDEILQVYRNLGGPSELPIEVERWEGIVHESADEPVSLSEITEVEKKLYATSLNSEIRRRQMSDYSGQESRSKGGTSSGGLGLMGRRRRGDSNGTDHPPLSLPRKTSWSSATGSLASPSTASPRARMNSGSGIDNVLNGTDKVWGGGKRHTGSNQPLPDRLEEVEEVQKDPDSLNAKEDTKKESAGSPDGIDNRQTNGQDPLGHQTNAPQRMPDGINGATTSMDKLSLNNDAVTTQSSNQPDALSNNASATSDLSTILWSYIDPSGNVQGPFPGETMQRWNDQHYFTDNLLMKRTNIDAEFMPLAEIKRRARGDQTFLSPLSSESPPPGLGHIVPGLGVNPLLQRTVVMDMPRQPSPLAYGRNSALDSLINTGSSATGSGSPSSSLGGSFARGSMSSDPIAAGSRLQCLALDAALNGRASAAGSYSSNGSPAMSQPARQIFNEHPPPNRPSSFDMPATGPWQITEEPGVQGWDRPSDIPHLPQPGQFGQSPPTAFGHNQIMRDSPVYANAMSAEPNSLDPFFASSTPSHRFYGQPDTLGSPFQQLGHEPSRFEGPLQQPVLHQMNTGLNHVLDQQIPSPSVTGGFHSQVPALSPWGAPHHRELPRPGPFDAERPTSNNTFVVSLPHPAPKNKPQPGVQATDPWSSTRQGIIPESQGQRIQDLQSLTIANVNEHNEQQHRLDSQSQHAPYAAAGASEAQSHVPNDGTASAVTPATENHASATLTSALSEAPSQPPQSAPKRKGNAAPVASTSDKTQPATVTASSKASSGHPKAAWVKDDDGKSKPTSMTLRDIQEQEKKKQEALKKAEKEREHATRATSPASHSGEVQFTASWGLPSSQVGARSNGAAAQKEASATSPAATAPPHVWSNAPKPAAKTMKEIQEEEERRKKAAKDRETAATAARRAVQAPAVKSPAVNAQSSGGAWSVVGAGGKVQTAASAAAARPNAVAQASPPNVQATSSRPAASQRTASSPAVSKAPSSNAKVDDEPSAPSLEFMKWMRDSLRGLNSSVQFEEMAHMLLSFPLDPDKATKEIIAETVYGASTTLNGHDFAEEFIKKRKEDALSRLKSGNGQASNGKPVSLADVVKAQPKQPQNDFGVFKVVKKKNKRS